MNIALQFRPVNIRLYVAYMADARHGGYAKCDAGNTGTRWQHVWENGTHPYMKMWNRIIDFYDTNRLYEMSDDEIVDMFNNARANGLPGTAGRGRSCTGMDIMRAKQRWADNGWTRYERKRAGRRTVAKMAIVPTLACFGIVLPQ